jgi:hypothetical protein
MNKKTKLLLSLLAVTLAAYVYAANQVTFNANGINIGDNATDQVAFYGATGQTQRTNAAEAALVDNTGGTPTTTLSPNVGVFTLAVPVNLSAITQSGAIFTYTPGFNFKLISAAFSVNTPATTAAKAANISAVIGATTVSGSTMALTTVNTGSLSALVAGAAITGQNTGTSASALTLTASSVTAFSQGSGMVLLTVQNMDHANAESSQTALLNELRTSLVNLGLIKGQ